MGAHDSLPGTANSVIKTALQTICCRYSVNLAGGRLSQDPSFMALRVNQRKQQVQILSVPLECVPRP